MKISSSSVRFLSLMLLALSLASAAQAQVVFGVSSLSWGNILIGRTGISKSVSVTNQGSTSITITGYTLSPGFQITDGVFPTGLGKNIVTHYSVQFAPTTRGQITGTFTLNISNGTTVSLPLNGIGGTSNAIATLSTKALTFSQPVGSPATQTLTITNTGAGANFKITSLTVMPSQFVVSGQSIPVTIQVNKSVTFNVTYNPDRIGAVTGALNMQADNVLDIGVSLNGTSTAATALTVSSPPNVPKATRGYIYQYNLAAVGNTGSVTWGVSSGNLPSGLALASNGLLSGTPGSTIATGNYTFTVRATDGANNATATKLVTLAVNAVTNANCANISFSGGSGNTPLLPLDDLGSGNYFGSVGGLYLNGSNVMPASHQTDGTTLASQIQPLDANGNPSSTGKYALLGLGPSVTLDEVRQFAQVAQSDPAKNPNLVVINGGAGGETAGLLSTFGGTYWGLITNNLVPNAGVTTKQVVAIYLEGIDGQSTGTFPNDQVMLQSELEATLQNALVYFPNLKLGYLGSRAYAGYSNGVSTINPEPYAYEEAFASKGSIGDQLNGLPALNYDPAKGAVLAPWLAWGSYHWANGMTPKSSGLLFVCQDFNSDGTHTSTDGSNKTAATILQFFKTDPTTTPWFLIH